LGKAQGQSNEIWYEKIVGKKFFPKKLSTGGGVVVRKTFFPEKFLK
jgi:hypothetical protein